MARRTGTALIIAAVMPAAAIFTSGAGARATTGPGPDTKVTVPQGTGQEALARGRVFGTTPADTPERVSFIFNARNLGQLEASVQSGAGGHLPVAEFARRYGQPAGVVFGLRSYLASFGISSVAYADGLDVSATGTAGQFDRALSVRQQDYSVPAVPGRSGRPGLPAQRVHGTTQPPMLPCWLARHVLAILGLTSYASFTDRLSRTPAFASHQVSRVEPSPLPRSGSTRAGDLTPAGFARNYRLDPLYRQGATGQGQTTGVVTLAGLDPATPAYFWRNVLHLDVPADRITVQDIDGGPGAPSEQSGSSESDLDVEQSGAVAPQARIVVYQGPNSDPGFADSFFAAASQNLAGTVSSSWGAAGDAGAYDASAGLGSTDLSVDSPGDSPFVTAAGGTTLGGTVDIPLATGSTVTARIPAERTWGWDWLWPLWRQLNPGSSEARFAEGNVIGGGGGFSQAEPAPAYQAGLGAYRAVAYLTPDQPRSPFTPLGTTGTANDNLFYTGTPGQVFNPGSGLGVPDLAALAADFSGG
jgi:subtilase family serine protease